jgi:hypothetical protein
MASDRIHLSSSSAASNIHQDLLQLVLEDQASYPWEANASSLEFLNELDQQWVADQTTEELEAIHACGQSFFAQLDQQWASVSSTSLTASIKVNLVEHFGDRVPQSLLASIAEQAQAMFATQQPMADQLVNCVKNLLSGLSTDDLFVLARPYAYAMRGNESDTLEAALRSVRCAAWTELSGVEQARLSLAIARYTLSKLSTQDT